MLTIERIEDEARFTAMREEWNALLGDSDADCLFLTWEWLHTWWRHLGGRRRLFLLAARRGGELVAIAPLALAPPELGRLFPFRSLQLLGTGAVGSDYLDLIVRRGWEDEAIPALADHLRAERAMLELRQLSPQALAWRLTGLLEPRGWSFRQAQSGVSDIGLRRPTLDDVFLQLTGAPPSSDLLTAATSGKLDTADGVRTAAAPLLATATNAAVSTTPSGATSPMATCTPTSCPAPSTTSCSPSARFAR